MLAQVLLMKASLPQFRAASSFVAIVVAGPNVNALHARHLPFLPRASYRKIQRRISFFMTLLRVNFPATEFVPLITRRKAEVAMRVKIAASMPEVEWDSDASGETSSGNSELSCYPCVP